MTSERFARLIISDEVVGRTKAYRAKLPELDALRQEAKAKEALIAANPDPKLPMNKELKQELRALRSKMAEITKLKTGLPVLMYQCSHFDETTSKKGYTGRWRKQQAARLNGLFMLDVDHVENTRTAIADMLCRRDQPDLSTLCTEMGIVLVHVTPSGHGLRFVAKASEVVGNLADNQQHLADMLGVEPDKACKDASRCSFCPTFEDILFINKEELFNYEDFEYDEKYGPLYRGGSSQPTHLPADGGAQHSTVCAEVAAPRIGFHVPVAPRIELPSGSGSERVPKNADLADQVDGNNGLANRLAEGYHGKSYKDICDVWFTTVLGGTPQAGDRHQSLYRLACDIRYICDFNPELLARILAQCDVGNEVAAERGQAELARIAADACAQQRWRSIPQRFVRVLQAAGIQLAADGAAQPRAAEVVAIDYGYWWQRLEPLLRESPVLREAVASLPEHHRLGGVLAAGAMLGTYLTRTWWEHFDGKDYRLSFLVYVIGSAASGKSFVPKMDALIMAPMMAADRVGREWERQYKEEMKKRAASSKNAKAEAPEQQHPVIRYVPSTISNAMLYRRLTDAVDPKTIGPDGHPLHLHCYTCEAELATALRAQQGSWAGKLDLECKSFQNEVAGVDYANDQSVNGIIQVNWNQVVTGTPDAMRRKIRPATVLDGLATRLVLFPMPANDFVMIDRRRALRDHERECTLRSAGLWLEEVKGELRCDRLVDFCYNYERRLADEARLEQDHCLDYFRKRIPLIMVRYTLVRMVLRQKERALKGMALEVTDSDLEFARLIGDFCLMSQMYFFGQQVLDALQSEREAYVPRNRSMKTRLAYASLPDTVTAESLVQAGVADSLNSARKTISRWLEDGLLKPGENKREYRKTFKEIPE